jgi:Flp pilus assembly protein TadG
MNRIDKDEDGAVVLMAALLIPVFLGILMLVIDLGGLVAEKRVMVRAADSAALAAAQSCARSSLAREDPEAVADRYATRNEEGATGGITESVGCHAGPGRVTVRYTVQKEMFFAPLIGIDTSTVAAEATATWGSPGLLPIEINLGDNGGFTSCNIYADDGEICYVLFDNDRNKAGLDEPGAWGFLNLETWGVGEGGPCPSAGHDLTEWIRGQTAYVLYGIPDWVCRSPGNPQSVWSGLEPLVGQIRTFPINDPVKSLEQPHQWYIVGFSDMLILGGHNTAHGGDSFGDPMGCSGFLPPVANPNHSYTCLTLQVVAGNDDGSAETIRLVK